MEIFLSFIIFALAICLLGAGRRTRITSAASGDKGDWPVDFQAGSQRIGDVCLEDLRRSFGRFADERQGRRLDRAPYEGPRVAYLYRGARAVLSFHVVLRDGRQEDWFTQMSYAVPAGWRHRIELGPMAPDELGESTLPGLVRVRTDDFEFDRRTRILASDAAVARTIMDSPTRAAMTDLRELLANGHMHFSASASRILVRKRGVIRDLPDLSLFARLCDAVYDRLLRAWERENGIEILEESTAPEDGQKCQVCYNAISAETRVRCRRCRTPHHPDCWDFNGGCATFACGEKHTLKGAA
jgi:hypothetical protein